MASPGFIKVTQRLFFDSAEILRYLDKAEVKTLSRFGAFVMTSARRSMRKPGKKGEASKPGQPPKARIGTLKQGKFGVQFAFDTRTRSVVIGAQDIPNRTRTSIPGAAVLEGGGEILVKEAVKKDGSWSRTATNTARYRPGVAIRNRRARIEPRPYMAPAYAKEKPKLMGMWKDSMNKR